MSAESWMPIPNHPGYEVTEEGRVRSWRPCRGTAVPRLLHPSSDSSGYQVLNLMATTGRPKVRRIHQLVLEAFIGPLPEGATEVRHLNGCRSDNRLANLKYGTSLENAADTRRHGTHWNARKTHCKRGHEFTDDNTNHRRNGGRECKACSALVKQEYKTRRTTNRRNVDKLSASLAQVNAIGGAA